MSYIEISNIYIQGTDNFKTIYFFKINWVSNNFYTQNKSSIPTFEETFSFSPINDFSKKNAIKCLKNIPMNGGVFMITV